MDAVPGKPLCTLRIHVTGFRNDKGKAGGVIFASPAGWPEDRSKAVAHGGFDIHDQQVTEEFQVPPGKYAVVVIHDENAEPEAGPEFPRDPEGRLWVCE